MKTSMTEKNACIAICPTVPVVRQALGKLQAADIDLQQVSVVGRGHYDAERLIGFYRVGQRVSYCGLQSDLWDDLWKLLAGAAFFWVPGFGPLTAAGPIVSSMVSGLQGVTIDGGFGVLEAALFDMGVPRDGTIDYEQAVRDEHFLLIVHDGRDLVECACKVLHCESHQVTVHRA